jgi:AAA domain
MRPDDWSAYFDNVVPIKATQASPETAARNGRIPDDADHPYIRASIEREILDLSAMPPQSGRNTALNNAAIALGRWPVNRAQLRDLLIGACASNGLLAEDGQSQCDATISSGFAKADLDGPRMIPDRPEIGALVIEVDAETLQPSAATECESQDLHQIAVTRRAYDLRVNDEARALWTRQRAAMAGQDRPSLVNLVDMLAQPDEDAQYRITDLLPIGGRALLAAQYKAGKTSMIANLLRSLVDGDKFLHRFPVTPVARVVLIDTELDERMLRRWLRDQGIKAHSSIDVLCLRGRLTSFDITNDVVRADWAAAMEGADFIILDCLRPCLDALGLSEDKEAGIILTAFDGLCRESGATEGVVVHHMGHGQERSRGDSRLLDWPDVLWKIVREDPEDDNGERFFSAMGRDVNLPESRLDWDPNTRGLMLCDGSRAEKRARDKAVDIIEIMSDPDNASGLSMNRLEGKLKALGNSRDGSRKAVHMAIDDGILLTIDGPRNSRLHILNPSRRHA